MSLATQVLASSAQDVDPFEASTDTPVSNTRVQIIADPPKTADPAIRLTGLTKDYQTPDGRFRVLDGIDLEIPRGTCTALKGVSGSGKSTLLHILGGVDTPTSGKALVDGVQLSGLSRNAQADFRAKHIGFIFQFFNLMPTLTASENVASALEPLNVPRKHRTRLARKALLAVGLKGQAEKFPARLSGGQQQRVAIARAIVKLPPVILADEPTGALDARTAHAVMDCLIRIQRATNATLVIATHDDAVAAFADRTYLVGEGRLQQL
jgi:putative ABC transport system ATP-binding protein